MKIKYKNYEHIYRWVEFTTQKIRQGVKKVMTIGKVCKAERDRMRGGGVEGEMILVKVVTVKEDKI